jgi:drug/metabolite transporter (DMT)-like permease
MTPQRNDIRKGIALMALTSLVFSVQDALSRHLAEAANTFMIVTVRFWFLGLFVILLARARPGGVRAAAATDQPLLQIARGLLLVAEVCLLIWAFTVLGLAASHAVFAASPLIVAALSGPLLGEKVGWRRWAAIGVGFLGILVILRPGAEVFDPMLVVPLASALGWALYVIMTRRVQRTDSATSSLFWNGVVGAAAMTPLGLWFWEPMSPADWGWMAALCLTALLSQWMLIKTYELAEASAVQPFAYLQLVFASAMGVLVFDETLHWTTALGGVIVVGAGLFTLWRERVRRRRDTAPKPLDSKPTVRETA